MMPLNIRKLKFDIVCIEYLVVKGQGLQLNKIWAYK